MLDADLLADQVFGFLDTRIGIDEHEAVAEPTMQEDGNGIERFVLILGDEISRARGFRHVEVLIVVEPPMPRRGIHIRQYSQVNTVGFDDAVYQRTGDGVIATGQGQGDILGHSRSCSLF